MARKAHPLARIERLNYLLGAAAIAVAALVTGDGRIAAGVAVGVVLTCANFFVLNRLVTKWTADAAAGRPSNASLLVVPKMVGLMIAVVLSLMLLPIDPIAFTIGYSTFIVSIILDTTFHALWPSPDLGAEAGDESDDHHG
jgi:hypothetical protein